MQQVEPPDFSVTVTRLSRYLRLLALLSVALILATLVLLYDHPDTPALFIGNEQQGEATFPAGIPDKFEIPPYEDTKEGRLAKQGYQLITETYKQIGPETKRAITGNRLACSSCHLKGGTKPYAAPFIGLTGVFPTYIGRENKIESLEERINGCFERSMNGRAIDVNSLEMRAIVTYMKHISKDMPVGTRIEGQGFTKLVPPNRPADPKRGALVYQNNCISCHGKTGEGLLAVGGDRNGGYTFPPLWGQDSYNDGAGMARLLTAARFIKANMPLGVGNNNPLLSDDEAYDVAAYINSHNRPLKENKRLDYPDLSKKPKDCPYPPYLDDTPAERHRLGPFNFGE